MLRSMNRSSSAWQRSWSRRGRSLRRRRRRRPSGTLRSGRRSSSAWRRSWRRRGRWSRSRSERSRTRRGGSRRPRGGPRSRSKLRPRSPLKASGPLLSCKKFAGSLPSKSAWWLSRRRGSWIRPSRLRTRRRRLAPKSSRWRSWRPSWRRARRPRLRCSWCARSWRRLSELRACSTRPGASSTRRTPLSSTSPTSWRSRRRSSRRRPTSWSAVRWSWMGFVVSTPTRSATTGCCRASSRTRLSRSRGRRSSSSKRGPRPRRPRPSVTRSGASSRARRWH
mmetsp:Transcript_84037/g.216327  ORF Transcript_84037/g.216327 Transcript_84037/m.216327 type:complete len:279 (+) Transcript_84037:1460-2296(+)